VYTYTHIHIYMCVYVCVFVFIQYTAQEEVHGTVKWFSSI